nr:unknown [Homo sapiens]
MANRSLTATRRLRALPAAPTVSHSPCLARLQSPVLVPILPSSTWPRLLGRSPPGTSGST